MGRGQVGEGTWLSLCVLLQRKSGISHPLFLLVSLLATGKSEEQLDAEALGCPMLRISAFWGRTQ